MIKQKDENSYLDHLILENLCNTICEKRGIGNKKNDSLINVSVEEFDRILKEFYDLWKIRNHHSLDEMKKESEDIRTKNHQLLENVNKSHGNQYFNPLWWDEVIDRYAKYVLIICFFLSYPLSIKNYDWLRIIPLVFLIDGIIEYVK